MKTYLALDIGEKRIGLAVGALIPFGRGVIEVESPEQVLAELRALIAQEAITHIVVGVPIVKSGEVTPSVANAEAWIERLKTEFKLPVYAVNEALTSREAERQLRDEGVDTHAFKDKVDERSAQLILSQYFHEQQR
jgi:putative transcription antitermination factor YqgF